MPTVLPPIEKSQLNDQKWITPYLKIVNIVLAKMRNRLPASTDWEELYSAGVMGLIEAAQKFNPERGYTFETFASFRVKGAMQDSLRQLNWRIYNETRDIAGFECKKAVAKICDSVVVVAFFTDQITVNAGPESFSGLPGMILGLAVPRLGTTWYATRVEVTPPTTAQLTPKQKGKKVNWVTLNASLKKAMSDWGKWGARRTWIFNL
jgi:RNA polymerase sigma factor (sigma-70 family)